MTNSSQQLPLNLKQITDKTFTNYIVDRNTALIDSVQKFTRSDETLFYYWGVSGAGKSHLLKALANKLQSVNKSIAIIDFNEISLRENISLISMVDYICIDNAECIASDNIFEEALFIWINEIRQAQKKIIIAAQIPNKSEKWQLPDLISRLQAGRTHEIKPLDRSSAMLVFKQQAQQQGIIIDKKLEKYLINNCSMNMKFLADLLVKLDEATLVHKKPVTIPLLKKILTSNLVK